VGEVSLRAPNERTYSNVFLSLSFFNTAWTQPAKKCIAASPPIISGNSHNQTESTRPNMTSKTVGKAMPIVRMTNRKIGRSTGTLFLAEPWLHHGLEGAPSALLNFIRYYGYYGDSDT
jgi:hypothetical protein